MQDPFQLLGPINQKCSHHLANKLEELGVFVSSGDADLVGKCRGGAWFVAFHPLHSCLRFPHASVKYFQDAVRFGLIENSAANELSFRLAATFYTLRPSYRGHFSPLLKGPKFDQFLNENLSPAEFRFRESIHGWFADSICGIFPWPVIPEQHLRSRGWTVDSIVENETAKWFSSNAYLSMMAALDLVVWGAWLGFNPPDLHAALEWYRNGSSKVEREIRVDGGKAERIIIPLFSHGFQGNVLAFFYDLQPELKEPVLDLLNQYGQTLADSYAQLRRQEFLRTTAAADDVATIARAALRIVSPVESFVLECGGQFHGFSLRLEDGYWAGYDEVRMPEAADLRDRLILDEDCEVFTDKLRGHAINMLIKPIQDQPALDPVFTWLRLETRLSELFMLSAPRRQQTPVTKAELLAMKGQLENQIGPLCEGEMARGTLSKCKRLCLVEFGIENFQKGEVELTNNMMKARLEKKIRDPSRVTGYQIAGRALARFKLELDDDFKERFQLQPLSKDRVKLTWVPIREP